MEDAFFFVFVVDLLLHSVAKDVEEVSYDASMRSISNVVSKGTSRNESDRRFALVISLANSKKAYDEDVAFVTSHASDVLVDGIVDRREQRTRADGFLRFGILSCRRKSRFRRQGETIPGEDDKAREMFFPTKEEVSMKRRDVRRGRVTRVVSFPFQENSLPSIHVQVFLLHVASERTLGVRPYDGHLREPFPRRFLS